MRRPELGLAAGAVLAAALCLALPGVTAVRCLAGLPLLLILPGFAVTAAWADLRDLEPVARIACALGASLAVLVVGGVALDLVGIGLTRTSFTLLPSFVTLAAVAVSLRLLARPTAWDPPRLPRAAVVLLLPGLATLLALALLDRPQPDRSVAGYTALTAVPDAAGTLRVSVSSAEQDSRSYVLRVSTGQHVLSSQRMVLAPATARELVLTGPAARSRPLTLALLPAGAGTPYRELTLP